MGQKIKLQTLVHIFTNTDGFYKFYISQGSAATQLRCGGMFSGMFGSRSDLYVKAFCVCVI